MTSNSGNPDDFPNEPGTLPPLPSPAPPVRPADPDPDDFGVK